MSSNPSEEIELLERVLLRLGFADTDEKLESCVGRFLSPVILKITSPHENVCNKVVEVLTHIKRRITSRPKIKLPVEVLLEQYLHGKDSPILQNFTLIFIQMGFPRLSLEERSALVPKIVCCEEYADKHRDKFLMLVISDLNQIHLPADPDERRKLFKWEENSVIKKEFLSLLQDVLLLPYGNPIQEDDIPPGMGPYSYGRFKGDNWSTSNLETVKEGVVRLLCSGIFTDKEIFPILVVASSDTRHTVEAPASAELSKVCTMVEFSDPEVTTPLYTLFSGNINVPIFERKTTACSARIRLKLLLYLMKCRGKGIIANRSIQVIFEGLFSSNTNPKCKVLSLQFAEVVIKNGPTDYLPKVAQILLTGFNRLIGRESPESAAVQSAAYSALAQLARFYPSTIAQDLKIVLTWFDHLTNSEADVQLSIREALVAIAPAFKWSSTAQNKLQDGTDTTLQLNGQQSLLMAMLSDNTESKVIIVQNVTSVFLTTCFPEYYAPARYLLLLIAGERNSLRENVTSYLYGTSKKDDINYNSLNSIEHVSNEQMEVDIDNSSNSKLNLNTEKRVLLPSFSNMMQYVNEQANKRLEKNLNCTVVGQTRLPFSLNVYEEILEYLRICLWYSANGICTPGDAKYIPKLRQYMIYHYEESDKNELYQYLKFVQRGVQAKRSDIELTCLYDLLNAAPELLANTQMSLLESLTNSLRDVQESLRTQSAQLVGILWAYGCESDKEFDHYVEECLAGLSQRSVEHKHGWLLVLGHAISKRIDFYKQQEIEKNYGEWKQFVEAVKVMAKCLCENQWLLILAAVKCFSMLGKRVQIPNIEIEISINNEENDEKEDEEDITEYKTSTKLLIFGVIFGLLRNTGIRLKIREEAAKCLGYLAIGDGQYFTQRNLTKFLSMVKVQKDATLNIAMADALASTLCGYDVTEGHSSDMHENTFCDDKAFETFLNTLVRLVTEPNPHARQSCSVWLLAIVKHCSYRPSVKNRKQLLQYAFTELLSDDSEFVQDVSSRGLSLVYNLSNENDQNELANSLLNQLIGGKRKVNKVDENTEVFAEGFLGKTPTGGNMTTYKELCSLASDLNKPDMIYQFMQLANHNAAWNSKLGAAFGLKSLSNESKAKMQPYLGKIIPRLYRNKYDPTPKIQNSMISIWDAIVFDSKDVVERYYCDIMREILDNLTFNEWRVRIACCLAVRDLLKRPNGLRLRSEERKMSQYYKAPLVPIDPDKPSTSKAITLATDDVSEPELRELWMQLFRVMDDIHEGTRLAAQGTASFLSKLCVVAASSDHGKSGGAVAASILPFLLEKGVTHTVIDIRKISVRTISDMIDSSRELIKPHLASLVPCLLKATGEIESSKLSYLSTRLGADNDAQEAVDTMRAEAAKSQHTTETTTKCIAYIDYPALEKMTPAILDLIRGSVNLGTRIACAHFICLISVRLGKEMTPLVSKYLAACFVGLKDRNSTVRKYYASAIGHLVGIAKEQSIKNLFVKLDELYMENSSNRSVALVIQSINKRQQELLKDYLESALPLIFFAMHEEINEENKSHVELWKDLWNEITPGDAGLRMNLQVIIPKLEAGINSDSWPRKTQAANGIQTIATRLSDVLEEKDRLRLIEVLLNAMQGRTFQGKARLLQALSALCKRLNYSDAITNGIVEAILKECRKEEPVYRTQALASLGEILQQLDIDRFEEVYNMVWPIVNKKNGSIKTNGGSANAIENDRDEKMDDLTADERIHRAQIQNKLKETICETLGKCWPKNSLETQLKFQLQFAEQCSLCVPENTRPVQVSLMASLIKFLDRLQILNKNFSITMDIENDSANSNPNLQTEKKARIEKENSISEKHFDRNEIVLKICNDVLSAVTYSAGIPHTGLRKEALNLIAILIKRFMDSNDTQNLVIVKKNFEENLEKFQRDSAPEIRCRIKDIEEKFLKLNFEQ